LGDYAIFSTGIVQYLVFAKMGGAQYVLHQHQSPLVAKIKKKQNRTANVLMYSTALNNVVDCL